MPRAGAAFLASLPQEGSSRRWARPGDGSHLFLQEKVETQRQRFRLEFEKYRGFLALEEQLQLRRLEQEERATLQRLREGQRQLAQRGRALRELAQELEDCCRSPALDLLEVRSQGGRCSAHNPAERTP